MTGPTEADFETTIADWLVQHGGYQGVKFGNRQTGPADFDAVRGIDTLKRLAQEADGLRVAPWPRVYVDLLRSGVRGEEAAEHLKQENGERN